MPEAAFEKMSLCSEIGYESTFPIGGVLVMWSRDEPHRMNSNTVLSLRPLIRYYDTISIASMALYRSEILAVGNRLKSSLVR
jgi:hypothetical protein